MKKYTLIMILIMLSGCTNSEIDRAKQRVACSKHGGVYSYKGFYVLQCKDGVYIDNYHLITGQAVIDELEKGQIK